jgi:chaperonin GroEL
MHLTKGGTHHACKNDYLRNLLAAGVIDPTQVLRFAIQNAASVSSLMLTTEAMIAE